MPLSAEFHGTFVANGVQELVIDFLDHADRRMTDETSFANFQVKREEVETFQLGPDWRCLAFGKRKATRSPCQNLEEVEAFGKIRLETKAKSVGRSRRF